jgi:hypothetical protein
LETLSRYRAVVLPNVVCLSDEEAVALRMYVERGGALVATYETGCYAADGARREAGVLDDVLGVQVRGPLPFSYARLRRSATAAEEGLLAGFDGTDVITYEGHVRAVVPDASAGTRVHATLIPEIFPQPPDLSYPTLQGNDAPLVVTRRFGGGRVVYFAGQTDKLNVTSGHPDHGRLLANALAWALEGQPALVETDASEDVHVTLLRQPTTGTVYVHLVNYTGARGRPVVAPHAQGPLRVRIDVRLTRADAAAALLVSGDTARAQREGEGVAVTVRRLDRYEVVRIG